MTGDDSIDASVVTIHRVEPVDVMETNWLVSDPIYTFPDASIAGELITLVAALFVNNFDPTDEK